MIKQTIKTTLSSLLLVAAVIASLDASAPSPVVPPLQMPMSLLHTADGLMAAARRGEGRIVTLSAEQLGNAFRFPVSLKAITELTVPLCLQLNDAAMASFCNLRKLTITTTSVLPDQEALEKVLREHLPKGVEIVFDVDKEDA